MFSELKSGKHGRLFLFAEGEGMHPLLAKIAGYSTWWIQTEPLPFLIALLLNMAACLAVLAFFVFLAGIAIGITCSIIDAITNHAAESKSPQQQTGEGSPRNFGDGTPKT
ncbi:hypothetical protein DTL42_01290 [Bremerella cremea]|uniref:Uncharacterized protein n=1 Tax=Bremerella cremea TaxID=1031537 RepID=A0A368KXA9_9BACT|nr:hypothetical protein [Bremerella cremea]RCS55767.1 hypothetical protein DTL42_01290 [Bremerella cremea]